MLSTVNKNAWEGSALPALVPASFHESDEEEEVEGRKPFDIHQYFGLSPETPICLDSLKDPDPGQKPPYTYATLVKLAIWSSPHRKLTLSGIYDALERRFPWFKSCENPNAWKTSIRHSLSLLAVFQKMPPELCEPVKGHYWTVDFSKGEGYKRPRKRGKNAKKPTQESEEHEGSVEPQPAEVPSLVADSPQSDVTSNASSSMRMLTPPPSANRRPVREVIREVQIPGPPNPRVPRVRRQSQEWQEEQERMNRVFAPYSKVIQLEAVSPDERYRHYRMCTYLYPEDPQQKPHAPTELDLQLLKRTRLPRGPQKRARPDQVPVDAVAWHSKYAEQPQHVELMKHGSNGAAPILTPVRDSLAANVVPAAPPPTRVTRSTSKPANTVQVFAPSAASFEAYKAAASTRFRSKSTEASASPPPDSSPGLDDRQGVSVSNKEERKRITRSTALFMPTRTAAEPVGRVLRSHKKRKVVHEEQEAEGSETDDEEIDQLLDDD